MNIYFKNGSYIKTLPNKEVKRSKRGKPKYFDCYNVIEYYRRYPCKYFEDFFGLNLKWWQKVLVKLSCMVK